MQAQDAIEVLVSYTELSEEEIPSPLSVISAMVSRAEKAYSEKDFNKALNYLTVAKEYTESIRNMFEDYLFIWDNVIDIITAEMNNGEYPKR
jgi:phosphoglycerate-specific signal transduction histidine kinase